MTCFGFAILAKKFRKLNKAICIYSAIMFFMGFCIMGDQGTYLTVLRHIDISNLEAACKADEAHLELMKADKDVGWLIVSIAKMANSFDGTSKNMMDKFMCTETCPCYQSEMTSIESEEGVKMARNDTYFKYS